MQSIYWSASLQREQILRPVNPVPTCSFTFLLLLLPSPVVHAYMGPTLGLGIVGTVIAVILVSLLSLFAFVFVPLRRLLRKKKHGPGETGDGNP